MSPISETDNPTETKMSWFGLASLLLTLFAGAILIIAIGVATYLVGMEPKIPDDDPRMIVAGLFMIGSMFLLSISFVLEVIPFFEAGKGKIMGVLGALLSLMILLGTILLIVLGLAMG